MCHAFITKATIITKLKMMQKTNSLITNRRSIQTLKYHIIPTQECTSGNNVLTFSSKLSQYIADTYVSSDHQTVPVSSHDLKKVLALAIASIAFGSSSDSRSITIIIIIIIIIIIVTIIDTESALPEQVLSGYIHFK